MQKTELTAELVRKALDYDPQTGLIVWRDLSDPFFEGTPYARKPGNAFTGKPALASRVPNGLIGNLFGKFRMAHRVAWLHYYGENPIGIIDHINHDCTDNRIVNLRDVTHTDNMRNRKRTRVNSSGVLGVFKQPNGKWLATIGGGRGKLIRLGVFAEKEEAIRARKDAEWVYGYHDLHGS